MLSQQLQRCKESIVRLLGASDAGEQMSRTSLSRALRSDVRPRIEAAIDELTDEGVLVVATTGHGRAYHLCRLILLLFGRRGGGQVRVAAGRGGGHRRVSRSLSEVVGPAG